MAKKVRSHKQVLELWQRLAPGVTHSLEALSKDFGVPYERVVRWYYRNSVPPKYWPGLIALAKHRFNVTITPREMMMGATNGDVPVSSLEEQVEPISETEQAA